MYSVVSTAVVHGIMSLLVHAEADVCDGMPGFEMVGIPSSEVREARERVRAAIRNSGYRLPPKRITVNLCPADVRKSGTGMDLPIALAVLAGHGIIPQKALEGILFVGEITLKGGLRPVRGVLPMVQMAKRAGYLQAVVPRDNLQEAGIVKEITILPADDLSQVLDHLKGIRHLKPAAEAPVRNKGDSPVEIDFQEIQGQLILRRACEVAAAGMHNLLMIGPPGTGKTMAAKAIPGILPGLEQEELMELAELYSVSGLFQKRMENLEQRPFRCPHHSITPTALVGGGRTPQPGEISLAHCGVLFLDELTEYARPVLEQLRQPLEDRQIRIVRLWGTYQYPADFMLVAAMNPCGCGYFPDRSKCSCTPGHIHNHLQKVSRPLMDRMDLSVEVARIPLGDLAGGENESSVQIRQRVEKAHKLQHQRYQDQGFRYNSRISASLLDQYCPMDKYAAEYLRDAYEQQDLSARAYHRLIRVARTIADLDGCQEIGRAHMQEALLYRSAHDTMWKGGWSNGSDL